MSVYQMYRGDTVPADAVITARKWNNRIIYCDTVRLPYTFPVSPLAANYKIETPEGTIVKYVDANDKVLPYAFYRENDSIYLKAESPINISFWYTIRKNKKVISSGYTDKLDYQIKDKGKNAYSMQLSYVFKDENKNVQASLPLRVKNISMEIATPGVVYPGQTVPVEISVKDKKGNPVKNTDITAYAFTSKFKASSPAIPVSWETRQTTGFNNLSYVIDRDWIDQFASDMTWERWRKSMSLDTIQYYQFLHPEPIYYYSEPAPLNITQLSPYVVINGRMEGVHLLWIDGQLFYAKQAHQLDSYSFPVLPGVHTIRFRTYDREIEVRNIHIEPGMKTILSVDGSKDYMIPDSEETVQITVKIYDKKGIGVLSDEEYELLTEELITVEDNLGKLRTPGFTLDIPAYIKAGNMLYYINHSPNQRYNKVLGRNIREPFLVGPFPYRGRGAGVSGLVSFYIEGDLLANLVVEGGNNYLLYKDFQKIENWVTNPINRKLESFMQPLHFHQNLLTENTVLGIYTSRIRDNMERSRHTIAQTKDNNNCILNLLLAEESETQKVSPQLILFTPENSQEDSLYLYYGGIRRFSDLPEGNLIMTLIFEHTCYHHPVTLHEKGINYLSLKSVPESPLDNIAARGIRLYQEMLKKDIPLNPYSASIPNEDLIFSNWEIGHYDSQNALQGKVTGVVRDLNGEPLIGVHVAVEGMVNNGTVTNLEGEFALKVSLDGYIILSYIGYNNIRIPLRRGYRYDIHMEPDSVLDEVVVTGAGRQGKITTTGAITTVDIKDLKESFSIQGNSLAGNVAGIIARQSTDNPNANASEFWIRGINTFGANQSALILVNGIEVQDLSQIPVEEIVSFSVLKDASATAIYGARAAKGVILIETRTGGLREVQNEEDDILDEPANRLRHNFHDDAFWHPRLQTDENGRVVFAITYPDDITSWDAHFIAVGNSRQIDHSNMIIRSFKSLAARLSVPGFAIQGDSLTAFGRIANQTTEPVEVKTIFKTTKEIKEDNIWVEKSYTDILPVKAESTDTICVTYALERTNGYFDGEERRIPVFQKGVLETNGVFIPLRDSLIHTIAVAPELSTAVIYAETSSLSVLEKEIEELLAYRYTCNEQTASKIKALIAQKRLYKAKSISFKEDKRMREWITQLVKNQNKEGLWGWWNQGQTDIWISRQVIEALLEAEKEEYKVQWDKELILKTLKDELERAFTFIRTGTANPKRLDKGKLLDQVSLLYRLHKSVDYSLYVDILKELPDHSLADKFKMMQLCLLKGEKNLSINHIIECADSTSLGSIYWKEKSEDISSVFSPYKNNVEISLLAYDLLKQLQAEEKMLSRVRDYFYECRQSGRWMNTYQSSRVIETLLPDLIQENQQTKTTVWLNGSEITDFPYKSEYSGNEELTIQKEGTGTIFFTLYQQGWKNNPENISEGFSIKTAFRNNNDTLAAFLPIGKSIELDVVVHTSSDKGYVMLEVPIPAGCSYESKSQGNNRYEIHREYFREKVCIFCNYLPQGEHIFTIRLTPRFNGMYSLNPARVELMYFPTLYGHEKMKYIEIKEIE